MKRVTNMTAKTWDSYLTNIYIICIWYYCVFGIVALQSYKKQKITHTLHFFLHLSSIAWDVFKSSNSKKETQANERKIHLRRLKTWFGSIFFSFCFKDVQKINFSTLWNHFLAFQHAKRLAYHECAEWLEWTFGEKKKRNA